MNAFKNLVKKYFSNFAYFYSILRARLLVVLVLSIVVGFLDSIGLTMFLPLLQLADGEGLVDLGNLSFITDFLESMGIQLTIVKALLFLIFIFLIKGIVVYNTEVYKIKTQQKLTKEVRMSIVNKFPVFSFNQFIKTDIGKIQNIFLGEIGRLSNTYKNYINMMQGIVLITMYMTFSFVVDWKFALLVCVGGLLSNLIFRKINKLTKEKSKHISSVNNKFANTLIQYVQNFKYLKATGKILDFRTTVEHSIDDVQFQNLQMGVLNSKVSAFREPLLILIVALVILLQVTFFDARISAIMVSLLFFYRALTSVVNVQNNYNTTLANQGAIDNIMSFLNELKGHTEKVGKRKFLGLQDKIEYQDVIFNFDDTRILDHINIAIHKNKTIALVGESGSGKTTLVNTLTRLLTIKEGKIKIDGIDLYEYNQFSFQKKIGYISQEPVIFNDTIYNNVTFWADPTPENLVKFEEAIKKASIYDFIQELSLKENAKLGNSGINLSGGQRQRISIARELYKDVELLILDEATSALDSETEQEIQESIDQLKGTVTVVIIAHRLATIKNADTIYLMDRGQIIGQGSFAELSLKSERFKRMVELQEI
jgi:ABC-type multidrug transport system fused ATPase/permease subunit